MLKTDSLIESDFICDDIILIHSIRPERLFTQIKSLVDNQIEFIFKKRKSIIKNKASDDKLRKFVSNMGRILNGVYKT